MHEPSNERASRSFISWVGSHRWLLIAAVVIAVAASGAYSATQTPTYTSQASVSFQDPSLDLGLVGLPISPTQTPDQLAAAGAQTIIEPQVAVNVKSQLHSSLSARALLQAVAATAQPTTNLVVIQATAPSAGGAQGLANAFAKQGAAATNSAARAQYAAALAQIRQHAPPKSDLTGRALYGEQLSRFQALSTIATPARVVDPARRPTSPSSPRPVRNGILAAVFGLVLGLFAAYIRDALDRRLRSVSDITQQVDLPLLGHVRTEALGRSPQLNGDTGVSAADWELFRILRRNLDFVERQTTFRTVAVTSSMPQEGKSTVAACLAFISAAAGKRTLLLECDFRRPVLAKRLELAASPGVTDYVTGQAEPSAVLQVVRFGDPISVNGTGPVHSDAENGELESLSPTPNQFQHQIACIVAGSATRHPTEILRSDRFRTMLAQVHKTYDLVILDTPPLLSVADTLELLPDVDAALLCVRLSSTTRQQASAGIAAMKRLPERPTGLVVTGTRRGSEEQYGYYGYYS